MNMESTGRFTVNQNSCGMCNGVCYLHLSNRKQNGRRLHVSGELCTHFNPTTSYEMDHLDITNMQFTKTYSDSNRYFHCSSYEHKSFINATQYRSIQQQKVNNARFFFVNDFRLETFFLK